MNAQQWTNAQSDAPDLEVISESALAMAQATIQKAMDRADVSKAELARSMDRPRSFVTRMLSGSHNLTVKTMARALSACGYEIDFGLKPLVWTWPANETHIACNQVPSTAEGTLVPAREMLVVGCS